MNNKMAKIHKQMYNLYGSLKMSMALRNYCVGITLNATGKWYY